MRQKNVLLRGTRSATAAPRPAPTASPRSAAPWPDGAGRGLGGQIMTFGRDLFSNADTGSGGNADSKRTSAGSRIREHRHTASRQPNHRH